MSKIRNLCQIVMGHRNSAMLIGLSECAAVAADELLACEPVTVSIRKNSPQGHGGSFLRRFPAGFVEGRLITEVSWVLTMAYTVNCERSRSNIHNLKKN